MPIREHNYAITGIWVTNRSHDFFVNSGTVGDFRNYSSTCERCRILYAVFDYAAILLQLENLLHILSAFDSLTKKNVMLYQLVSGNVFVLFVYNVYAMLETIKTSCSTNVSFNTLFPESF